MTRTAACMLAILNRTGERFGPCTAAAASSKEFVTKWKRWLWGKADPDPATMPTPKQPCKMGTYTFAIRRAAAGSDAPSCYHGRVIAQRDGTLRNSGCSSRQRNNSDSVYLFAIPAVRRTLSGFWLPQLAFALDRSMPGQPRVEK
jgi:hypothetical protein